jgi:ketosteroid isomerase-like protein
MVSPIGSNRVNRSAAAASAPNTAAAASKAAGDFYQALSKRDASSMARLYADGVQFNDPLFGDLDGKAETMRMWNSILPAANPKTFDIEPKVLPNPTQNKDGSWNVRVHWDAHYDLGKRHVDNHSDSVLTIKDGKITKQRDVWDLDKWTKQAVPGWLGGGTRTGDLLSHALAHVFIKLTT